MEINSIEWHEGNLKNQLTYMSYKIQELKELKKVIEMSEDKTDFYAFQIAEAKRNNRKTFDKEKYRVRNSKQNSKGSLPK